MYLYLLRMRLKSVMQYPLDMIVGVLGTILWHIPGLILILVLFSNSSSIEFSKSYLLLLYGLSVFGDGIQHTLFEALWQFGNVFIIRGEFDKIVTKPISDYLQVVTSRIDIDGFGGIILGLLCCILGIINMRFSVALCFNVFLALLTSSAVYIGINTCTSSLAFLMFDNFPLTNAIFQMHTFARYPKKSYPTWLSTLLSSIIPVYLATTYPIDAVFSSNNLLVFCVLCLAGIFLLFSMLLWGFLSRFYKSAGN